MSIKCLAKYPYLHANKSLLIFILCHFCFWSTSVFAQSNANIVILLSNNDSPYLDAVSGFKNHFTGANTKISELSLTQAQATGISNLKPDLIYTIGLEASEWANQQMPKIPIVATMVLKDDIFKKSANMTGVSLSYSLKSQFQWLRKFFLPPKNVAILFNPAENAAAIENARNIGNREGYKLVAIPVETPKELPYALEQLANNVDVLMAIPDEMVMSVNTAKEVLLASFSNKVPLIGLSDNWVKSGALYALSWDYVDLGKQSAELAQKILNGASVQSLRPENPRKATYTINAKIADHMNLNISDDLLNNAKIVFH